MASVHSCRKSAAIYLHICICVHVFRASSVFGQTFSQTQQHTAGDDVDRSRVAQTCCTCHEVLVNGSHTREVNVCLNKSMSVAVATRIVSEYYAEEDHHIGHSHPGHADDVIQPTPLPTFGFTAGFLMNRSAKLAGQSVEFEDVTVLSQWTWSFLDLVEADSIESALGQVFVGYAGSISEIRFSVEGGYTYDDTQDTWDEPPESVPDSTSMDEHESRIIANPMTGQVYCFPSQDGVYSIQLWATDGAGRRLLVWEWNMTASGFVIESANEYVPAGAETVVYEYWDDPSNPMRTKWEVNVTYHIAPINVTNPTIGGMPVDPERIMFILDPTPPGFFMSSSTGEVLGVPREVGNTVSTLYASTMNYNVSLANVTFNFMLSDLANSSNGPSGHGCADGEAVDGVPFDQSFTCHCNTGFMGPNCADTDPTAFQSSTTSPPSAAYEGVVAGVVIIVAFLLVMLTVLTFRKCREREKSLAPHDFGAMDIDQFGFAAAHARMGAGHMTINPVAGTPLRYPMELPRKDIDLLDVIGSGEYGVVYRGQLHNSGMFVPFEFDVAVKVLKDDASDAMTEELLREAMVTAQFEDANIIGLLGVVTAGMPKCIVLQHCAKGSLLSILTSGEGVDPSSRADGATDAAETAAITSADSTTLGLDSDTRLSCRRDSTDSRTRSYLPAEKQPLTLPTTRLLNYCVGIASGMKYLASKSFVHRDLAARNVLVDIADRPKVADFGLSREVPDAEYYRSVDENQKLPLRWTAPEAFQKQRFSEKSDVWAYGVTCIEVFTCGRTPYYGWLNSYVLERVESGYCLPRPQQCPTQAYDDVILPCFDRNTDTRPTFAALFSAIATARISYMQFSSNDESEEAELRNASEDDVEDSEDSFIMYSPMCRRSAPIPLEPTSSPDAVVGLSVLLSEDHAVPPALLEDADLDDGTFTPEAVVMAVKPLDAQQCCCSHTAPAPSEVVVDMLPADNGETRTASSTSSCSLSSIEPSDDSLDVKPEVGAVLRL
eukprot:m.1242679 g.1242679  ORF g.1242679 m.1242679 type:complete len:1001 (-) comp24683_c0_seq19:4077-7079(-)